MNIDETAQIQIDANLNTTSTKSSRQITPNALMLRQKSKPTSFSMRNTKDILKNNVYFSGILKKIVPEVCFQNELDEKKQNSLKKQQKYESCQKEELQINTSPIHTNMFHGSNMKRQSIFHPSPQAKQNPSSQSAQNWITSRKTFKAFNIKSNPFNFCEAIEEERNNE